uniref:TPM domain-containing protein n=1 Tax=Helicotheca tamesis TaxID=374047 RepID=A0A7S2N223_9STRA|mmetsp:Transcript_8196/g.11262  ORF Transcript_8196/g.11262 Transcript_8196/m.11262 type:complete len:246 (+) Transcript_8196:103-840(+)|eukprot:CAMPEP_0185727004 /NCGR_PEP_ID=MMETSP1171-20130828/2810_1 /TAXON_ID=374046 /ORGANISM="Helicotheca tamensis, Strain CCMP826" /LENGTH=245 /DNA_ID=CAMNT_0028395469 /DNA_START=101 /DNA_END=838 /DNA_ORIENTATION=+
MHLPISSFAALVTLLSTVAPTINAFNVPLPTSTTYQTSQLSMSANSEANTSRRNVLTSAVGAFLGAAVITQSPEASYARLEAVNRPDLLPSEPGQNVIQIQKFLTTGQATRMDKLLTALERDTGFRVRVLCQAYPQTPGLAVRDYWDLGKEGQKDDKYIVLVVDQFGGKGNVLNFNVGEGVKFALPNVFWTRLQAKYGTTFFVKENGIDIAVVNAIEAVVSCLRSEEQFCVNVPDEGISLKSLGM